MPDRNKVIKGIEHCDFGVLDTCYEKECPYYQSLDCTNELKNDIIALLKEQEPVPLIRSAGYEEYWDIENICPKCDTHWISLAKGLSLAENHFCPHCGQAVK